MSDLHGRGFVEVADRCFMARYAAWDTSIGAVVGSDGVLVVDTRATYPHGVEIRDHVARIAPNLPVRWVVNTHEHFDHVLGNAAFVDATVHAHEVAAASMTAAVERIRDDIRADPETDPVDSDVSAEVLADVLTSELRLPDATFASVATIDLGDRYVELLHPGRGHTAGDIVIRVPDADLVLAGDLIEESGPPYYGRDSFPLEWAASLDIVVGLLGEATVVIPGHGSTVDKAFVQNQRADISDVSQLIRSLYQQGVPVEDAFDAGGAWPLPEEQVKTAIWTAYAQLRESGATTGSTSASQPIGSSTLPLA